MKIVLSLLGVVLAVGVLSADDFTINDEVLGRYGYSMSELDRMSSSDRQAVLDWMEVLEARRTSAVRDSVVSVRSRRGSSGAPASRSEVTLGFTGGRLSRGVWHDPSGNLTVEAGNLGSGNLVPGMDSAKYVNISKGTSESVHYQLKGQVALVDVDVRPLSGPGAPTVAAEAVPSDRQTMVFGSVIGQAGNAYRLLGPVDWGWSVMGDGRFSGIFPNAVADETAGARLKLANQSLGVFGGVSESVRLIAEHWATNLLSGESPENLRIDKSPHASIAAWGVIPTPRPADYSVRFGSQKNPWTTENSAEVVLAAVADDGSRWLATARTNRETGPDIEFDRSKSSIGIANQRRNGLSVGIEAGRQSIAFGNVASDSRYILVSLKISESLKDGAPSLSLEQMLDGRQNIYVSPGALRGLTEKLDEGVGRLEALLNRASSALEGVTDAQIAELNSAYAALDPRLREILVAYLGPSFSREPFVRGGNDLAQAAAKLQTIKDRLSDPNALDNIIGEYARVYLYQQLANTEIKLLGQDVKLTPPVLTALMNAYNLGMTPVPPVTAADVRIGGNAYLVRWVNSQYGTSCDPHQELASCLMTQLPPQIRGQFEQRFGADLSNAINQAIGMLGDSMRREINLALLQTYLAADRLNALSVDHGERIGELNTRALTDAFRRLDSPASDPTVEAYRGAFARAERRMIEQVELDAERSRARLASYGQSRLEALEAAGAFPNVHVAVRDEDWPVLLNSYGDVALFDFIDKARAKVAAGSPDRITGLLIRYSEDPVMGMSVRRGRPTVLNLPPPGHRDPKQVLDISYRML